MKKTIAILCVICFGLALFISGCTQKDNSGTNNNNDESTTGSTVTMTAKEFNGDMSMDSDWKTYITIAYNSLTDGDALVIQDTISNISYDSDIETTTVKFEFTNGTYTGSFNLAFAGDITGSYQIGDEVRITVVMKRVTFSYQNMTYDIELFEEQWESQDYFISNATSALNGLKALPQSCIVKV